MAENRCIETLELLEFRRSILNDYVKEEESKRQHHQHQQQQQQQEKVEVRTTVHATDDLTVKNISAEGKTNKLKEKRR